MAKTQEVEVANPNKNAMQILLSLEEAGAIDAVSLTLTDPDMPYERWEDLGRFFGGIDKRFRWYLGDWLIFGEAIYGEQHAQAVEATTQERYSLAERVTGLDHGTLMNIRSVCNRVLKPQRREELGFWIHAEVAPLEPQEQEQWLQAAIDNGWSRSDLRDAIRAASNQPPEDDPPEPEGGGTYLSQSEAIAQAARTVYRTAQPTSNNEYLVPAESMAQLAVALGEERDD